MACYLSVLNVADGQLTGHQVVVHLDLSVKGEFSFLRSSDCRNWHLDVLCYFSFQNGVIQAFGRFGEPWWTLFENFIVAIVLDTWRVKERCRPILRIHRGAGLTCCLIHAPEIFFIYYHHVDSFHCDLYFLAVQGRNECDQKSAKVQTINCNWLQYSGRQRHLQLYNLIDGALIFFALSKREVL